MGITDVLGETCLLQFFPNPRQVILTGRSKSHLLTLQLIRIFFQPAESYKNSHYSVRSPNSFEYALISELKRIFLRIQNKYLYSSQISELTHSLKMSKIVGCFKSMACSVE